MRILLAALIFVSATIQLHASDSLNCSGKYNAKGEKHGVWVCKKADRLVLKERYRNGRLISWLKFNDKGELIETRDRKGRVKTYKPCGC